MFDPYIGTCFRLRKSGFILYELHLMIVVVKFRVCFCFLSSTINIHHFSMSLLLAQNVLPVDKFTKGVSVSMSLFQLFYLD